MLPLCTVLRRRLHAPPLPASLNTLKVLQPLPIDHAAHAYVWEVRLSRPKSGNAMTSALFSELHAVFLALGTHSHSSRAILLTGDGANFSFGLDLVEHAPLFSVRSGGDAARRGLVLRNTIEAYQRSVGAVAACAKPVIALVHGACVGGGVDLICAADVRLASACAWFKVAEVEVGLAADLGSLQRLPRALGSASLARELALTARRMPADEARNSGFLSHVDADAAAARVRALDMAARMASLSPVAVQGTKAIMTFSEGRPVVDGLAYAALHNQCALQTADIGDAAVSVMKGLPQPTFPNLSD